MGYQCEGMEIHCGIHSRPTLRNIMPDTSNYNKTRCPKCFQLLTTWKHHDPILTPKGYPYIFNDAGLLVPISNPAGYTYKGFLKINADIIKELQDNRHQAELDAGVTPLTVFTNVERTGSEWYIPNVKHIQELRDSTEKILTATGVTKETYFNFNDDGTECQSPHQLDWIDKVLTDKKYLLKDTHIEDLRKFIGGVWFEPYDGIRPFTQTWDIYNLDGSLTQTHPLTDYIFSSLKHEYILSPNNYYASSFVAEKSGTNPGWLWHGEGRAGVDVDITGQSSKLHLYELQHNVTGYENGGTVAQNYGIFFSTRVGQREVYKPITPTTKFTMDSVFSYVRNVTGHSLFETGAFVQAIVEVYFEAYPFNGSNVIFMEYYFLFGTGHGAHAIYLTEADLNNWNRNIKDDFTTFFGYAPTTEKIAGFNFIAITESTGDPTAGMDATLGIDWTIDNVRFQ